MELVQVNRHTHAPLRRGGDCSVCGQSPDALIHKAGPGSAQRAHELRQQRYAKVLAQLQAVETDLVRVQNRWQRLRKQERRLAADLDRSATNQD